MRPVANFSCLVWRQEGNPTCNIPITKGFLPEQLGGPTNPGLPRQRSLKQVLVTCELRDTSMWARV